MPLTCGVGSVAPWAKSELVTVKTGASGSPAKGADKSVIDLPLSVSVYQ
jgi:hypothetical protein